MNRAPIDPSAPPDFKYWAFISYSHRDRAWGDWLHKALETYRVPGRLVGRVSRDGKVPARLYPVFRDRDELPGAADLNVNIAEALRRSRYLVVICSPNAARSRWVNEEIRAFKAMGREGRILCLIADGEPNAGDKPESGLAECFPQAVRFRVDPDGTVTGERTEPIAADAREGGDGRRNSLLKLLAGLLGVSYDDLRQRERQRQRRRRALAGIAAAAALAAFLQWWFTPGTLNLDVAPVGTSIRIGDRSWTAGGTPIPVSLQRGPYEVRCELADHAPETREVWVDRGASKDFTLKLRHDEGTLEAESLPVGSEVEVDGVPYGSRIRNLRLDTGRHVLRARAPGCFERDKEIVLKKGEKARAAFWLDAGELWRITSPYIQGQVELIPDIDGDGLPDVVYSTLHEIVFASGVDGRELPPSFRTADQPLWNYRQVDLGGRIGRVILTWGEETDGLRVACVDPARKGAERVLWRWKGPKQEWKRASGTLLSVVADLNGDGVAEIAVVSRDGKLHVLDGTSGHPLKEHVLSDRPLRGFGAILPLRDRPADRILYSVIPGTPDLPEYPPDADVVIGCLCLGDGGTDWRVERKAARSVEARDIDGDGVREVVVWSKAGWDVLDGTTGESRMKGLFPPGNGETRPCLPADLDGDGTMEWLALRVPASGSANTGRLVAFRLRDGAVLWTTPFDVLPWQPEMPDTHAWLRLPGGEMACFAPDRFVALDPATGKERWSRPGRPEGAIVGDQDGNGKDEILVGRAKEGLLCLDAAGKPRWNLRLDSDVRAVGLATDLDGDGLGEVLLLRHAAYVGMVRGPRILWSRTATNPLQATPQILPRIGMEGGPGVVEIGAWGGGRYIAAFDGLTGAELWSREDWFSPNRAPVVADWDGNGRPEVAAIGQTPSASAPELLGFHAADGAPAFSIPMPPASDTYCQPVAADLNGDGVPDFATHRWWAKDVVAVDVRARKILWRHGIRPANMGGVAAADLDGDGVADVVAAELTTADASQSALPGKVVALRGKDGRVLWEVAIDPLGSRSPPGLGDLTGDGTPEALLISRHNVLWVLDGRTGKELWRWERAATKGPPDETEEGLGRPVVTDIGGRAVILAGLGPAGVVAFDWAKRDVLWQTLKEVGVISTPVIADLDGDGKREVIAGAADGTLFVLDLETGRVLWRVKAGNQAVEADPAVADLDGDGILDIVVACRDCKLTAVSGRATAAARRRFR